jgi:hypothetical protein
MEPTKQGGADPSGLDAGPLSRQPPLPYLVEEATPPPLDPPQLLQPQQCDGTVGGSSARAGIPNGNGDTARPPSSAGHVSVAPMP